MTTSGATSDRAWARQLSTPHKLVLLGSLYLSQGLPFGFFTQALPVLLREQGASLKEIGFTSVLALPWLLKVLWAPIVDAGPPSRLAFLGHHRAYLLPLQLAAVGVLFWVSGLDPSKSLLPVLVGVALTNLCAATQDIATDSLAVHVLDDDDRGAGNGVQVAAYRAGMILGGGTLLMFLDQLGWAKSFWVMAGLLLLATLPVLLLRETPTTVGLQQTSTSTSALPSAQERASYFAVLRRALSRQHLAAWCVVLVLFKVGDNFATGMVKPYLVDEGFSKADIGWMVGYLGFAASLVGALVGGALTSRIGRMQALFGFSLLQAIAVAGYAVVPYTGVHPDVLTAIVVADHLFGGMATAALFTCMMDTCHEGEAGTSFTVQASVVVLGTGLGSALSGVSGDALGHETHFIVGAIASFVCIAAAAFAPRVYHALRSSASTPATDSTGGAT